VLSRPSQEAPTPEFAKVFCFVSPEKKAFLVAAENTQAAWGTLAVTFALKHGAWLRLSDR
jgi:hypothetical protein